MSVTVFHPSWHAADVKPSGKRLHPVVQAGIVCGGLLILLIGSLFRTQVESDALNYWLNGAAAWGSIGLTVAAGVTALYAQLLPQKRAWLKSESNTVALIALMILGFFSLIVAYRGYWIASTNHRMSVEVRGAELVVSGAIGPGLPGKFKEALSGGTVHRLVLKDNSGGDVIAAILSSMALRDAGVTQVRIEGRCASSCAFLALLVPERFYAPDAQIGFHDVRSISGNRDGAQPDRDILRVSLRQSGLTQDHVDLILSSDEIVWYSPQQLVGLGIERGS